MKPCEWCDEETRSTCPECKGTGIVSTSQPTKGDTELRAKIAIAIIREFQSILGQRTENMKFYGSRMSEDEANNLAVQRMEQRIAELLKEGLDDTK